MKYLLLLLMLASCGNIDFPALVKIDYGYFKFGCLNDCGIGSTPMYIEYTHTFYITETEITQAQYDKCVDKGSCVKASSNDYNAPVIGLRYEDAKAVCNFYNMRLPTEAEWEKAARGFDERTYPWGEFDPGCDLVPYSRGPGDLCDALPGPDVVKYGIDKSPYGVYDMGSNGQEWTSTKVDNRYILKGGHWLLPLEGAMIGRRRAEIEGRIVPWATARCVKD